MEKFLEVKNLRVSYHSYAGEVQSVRGVSFSIDAGQSVAIVGESGCGKSVTAKTIMGLIQTPPGEIKEGSQILFEGRDILSQTPEQWQEYRGKDCAIIFQDALAALNPTMTIGNQVAEKLLIHTSMSRAEAWEEAGRLLKLVGIPNPEKRMKQYPHEFSGGQRQRIMIAIALACQPRLLIADEPTTALDVTIQADIIDLLKDIQKEFGMAVIMITHDLGIVANIAKKIIVMYAGKVVETGTDDKWGPVVAIEDASGRVWRVCGTTDAKVKKGDTVSAGQTIGKVGSVSCECAEESHIHLEVMEGEKYLDPIKAMK